MCNKTIFKLKLFIFHSFEIIDLNPMHSYHIFSTSCKISDLEVWVFIHSSAGSQGRMPVLDSAWHREASQGSHGLETTILLLASKAIDKGLISSLGVCRVIGGTLLLGRMT